MTTQKDVEQIIGDFIKNSPENTMQLESGEPAWEEAIIGFAAGADPLFESYKEHVGEFHFTPQEIFNLEFENSPAEPEELTVITWALLQREATRKDNSAEDFYPSDRWVMARFPGEAFNEKLRQHVADELMKRQIDALAPLLTSHYQLQFTTKIFYASNWSERHAAYAAGLGTFGLCDGLITYRGKAHRMGTVVARLQIPPSPRPYQNHNEYCLYYATGKCMACAKRCPVDAITENGHDKEICWDHAGGTCGKYVTEKFKFQGYGCGLCQTKVPCEKGVPKGVKQNSPT